MKVMMTMKISFNKDPPTHLPERWSDGKTQTERHVTDGVDAAVHGRVPDVHQVSQLGHHARVDHSDGEAQAGVRQNQVMDGGGHWDLERGVKLKKYFEEKRGLNLRGVDTVR